MACSFCGVSGHNVETCPERLEEYHGTAADYDSTDENGVRCWVEALDGTWHASMYRDSVGHACACGEIVEFPTTSKHDNWRIEELDRCEDCLDYLERQKGKEAIPDGGDFKPAGELRADGGQSVGVIEHSLHPSDESPQLRYCHRCVGDTLHGWNGDHWACESCGRRWSA